MFFIGGINQGTREIPDSLTFLQDGHLQPAWETEVKYCAECGFETKENFDYCPKCGMKF